MRASWWSWKAWRGCATALPSSLNPPPRERHRERPGQRTPRTGPLGDPAPGRDPRHLDRDLCDRVVDVRPARRRPAAEDRLSAGPRQRHQRRSRSRGHGADRGQGARAAARHHRGRGPDHLIIQRGAHRRRAPLRLRDRHRPRPARRLHQARPGARRAARRGRPADDLQVRPVADPGAAVRGVVAEPRPGVVEALVRGPARQTAPDRLRRGVGRRRRRARS